MRKFLYFLLFLVIAIASLLLWYDQSRKQFCLSEDKCITVWKRLGGDCYIIPNKYDSWFKPQKDYILIDNLGSLDIIWEENNHLLINSDDATIVNKSKNLKMQDYRLNKEINDSLYLEFDGRYHRYKSNIIYMQINAEENYATDNYGNKL